MREYTVCFVSIVVGDPEKALTSFANVSLSVVPGTSSFNLIINNLQAMATPLAVLVFMNSKTDGHLSGCISSSTDCTKCIHQVTFPV
jgi:hypothetical protein